MRSPRTTALWLALLALNACGSGDKAGPDDNDNDNDNDEQPQSKSGYRGTLTFAREGPSDIFNGVQVIDLDLADNQTVLRFDGFDAQRTSGGETAYITRLAGGDFADAGIVFADARGVTEAPVYVCTGFNHNINRICHTPKVSPDRRLIAFGIIGGGGTLCQDQYGLFWGTHVVVRDRQGVERARFEGYYYPEWLPDGRLLMLGSACRNAGVWIADRNLGTPVRIDGDQIGTPAGLPAVSPDGRNLALVWSAQLWNLTLDGAHELTQLTRSDLPVASAAWSPDGKALAVLRWDFTMPHRSVWLFRPGDSKTQEVRTLPFYPFGPISWN